MTEVNLTTERDSLFPIQHPEVFELYRDHLKCMWTPDEIDMTKDCRDFETLDANEQKLILHILAFFAGSDVIIMDNLSRRFCDEIKLPEARSFYSLQMFIENIHNEVYERLILTLVPSHSDRRRLLCGIQTIPTVGEKAAWARKWIDSDLPLGKRILAFIIVEGVFFSGSFCAIFWLRHRNILHGLMSSNDFISRDETLHANFGIILYNNFVVHRLSQTDVNEMIREAVRIESDFITAALPHNLNGMSAETMTQYIQFMADHWLVKLRYEPIFRVTNPFSFMVSMNLEDRTNFFERRNTTYTKANTEPIQDFKILTDDF